MERLSLPPRASSLSESMRDIGYSLESAVADIIDNSIAAASSRVDIWVDIETEQPVLGIVDNGKGMKRDELIDAMRYGSRHPRCPRAASDLGRFGLGLKTASFSQCRRLTVISRKKGNWAGAFWDLDVMSQDDAWTLGVLGDAEIPDLPYVDKLTGDGTLVLWQKLDRLHNSKLQNTSQDLLYEKLEAVQRHLELVFHRFLASEGSRKNLDIFINGHQIEAFDPFCLKYKATQLLPEETIRIDGHSVTMQPYTLPHHSKFSPRELDYYRDRSEFVSNQGAYIYRNSRLMAWGTWFKLVGKSEATKLARVRIDFPNALDKYWTIDIKKLRADPPPQVRNNLRQIISRITEPSTRVIKGKAQRLFAKVEKPIWARYAEHDGIRYSLNVENPILQAFENSMDEAGRKRFRMVLETIEKSVPVEAIYSDYSTNPKEFEKADESSSEETRREKLHMLFDILSSGGQLNEKEFISAVSSLKPFGAHPEEIETFIREKRDGG